MPDCLAVGTTPTSSRMPMRPQTRKKIADAFGCTLPTRKIVDAMDAAATVRLAPQAVTENREQVSAFVLANQKTERERAGQRWAGSSAGRERHRPIDEDLEKPKPPGHLRGCGNSTASRFQPLTNVHWNQYVDYSTALRLVRVALLVDGQRFALMSCSPTRRGAAW